MIPMDSVRFWQHFDVVVIATVSLVIGWLMVTHRKKNGALLPSISQTIAADKRATLLFAVMMTVAVPLYYAFIWFWVGPLVVAPWYFYALVAISFVAEMIFVWVPATSGKSKRIHEITAGFVGLTMFVAPLTLLIGGNLEETARLAAIAFTGSSVVMGVLLLTPKVRKYTLSFEIAYCIVFWVLMSYIAHFSVML